MGFLLPKILLRGRSMFTLRFTLRANVLVVLVLGLSISAVSAMGGTNGTGTGGTGTGKVGTRKSRSMIADNLQESQKLVRPLIQQDNARNLKQLVDMFKNAGLGQDFNTLVKESFDYAVECRSIKCVRLLLPHVLEIKHGLLRSAGKKALLFAAQQGDEPLVDALLVGNVDVSLFDNDHCTPLHHAARYLFNQAMHVSQGDDFANFDESIDEDIVLGIMQKVTAEDPTLIYKKNSDDKDTLDILESYAQSCRDEADRASDTNESKKWKDVAKSYDRLGKKIEKFSTVK